MADHPKNDAASEILRSAIERVKQSIQFVGSAEDKDELLGQVGFVEEGVEDLARVATEVVDSAAFLVNLLSEPDPFCDSVPLPPPGDNPPVVPTVENAPESTQADTPPVAKVFDPATVPPDEKWSSDSAVIVGPYMRRHEDSSDWRSETLHFYPPNRWLLVVRNVGALPGSNGVGRKPHAKEFQGFTPAQAVEWFLSWDQQVPSVLWDYLPVSNKAPIAGELQPSILPTADNGISKPATSRPEKLQTSIPPGEVVDESAYVPASRFIDDKHPNFKAINKALQNNSWIRNRRPLSKAGKENPRRLEIHAGDWHKYLGRCREGMTDPLDLPADVVEKAVKEVEQRKAQERARKDRE